MSPLWLGLALAQQVVEMPEGPTLASIRVRAMAGTCVSLAESATCQIAQPASVAVRRPQDDNDNAFDSTIQLPDHPVMRRLFFADEPDEPYRHIQMQVGAAVKAKRYGLGVHLRQDRWRLAGPDRGTLRWSMPFGVSSGSVVGAVAPIMLVGQFDGAVTTGFGVEGGALVAPSFSPWRFGLGVHSPVRTADAQGGARIRQPAKATAGVGYGFGLRNRSRDNEWIDRVRSGKHWVQVHGEVEVIGASGVAVGLLDGEQAPLAVTGRLGGEADLWEETLRVRAGSYGLVDRPTGVPQLHLTGGATVHLFKFLQGTRWRGGGCVDWSAEDTAFGFGLETW